MSEPPTLEEKVQEVAQEAVEAARGPALPKAIFAVLLVIAALLAAGLLGARFGVLLPQGRMLIEASANGLKLGRVGRLRVEGLEGDIWRDFSVRTLTISDEKGVWLRAQNVAVSWRYMPLFTRSLQVDKVAARQVTVLRRPTLTPKQKSGALPLSIRIDAIAARLEMLPAFSYRRGVYDVTGRFAMKRGGGGPTLQVAAASLLHAGDHLTLDLNLAKGRPMSIRADAVEAEGGALAGALGLPADQAFELKAQAGGATSAGKVSVVAVSGATRPVVVDGAWTPQGGQAQGRVSLTASSFTRNLAERLGPQADFTISGRKATKPWFDLQARAATANLTVVAGGRGDLGKRQLGPDGLAVWAVSAQLSRLTGGPQMGPAQLSGRLTGRLDDWRFAGDARISRLTLGGYQLDTVSGPLALSRRKGQYELSGKAAGAGGRGTGVAAALFGARPTAAFEASRLADGRLALKDLQATGSGLKVQASGGRSLLGGLNFKGEAQFSNLAAARPGASGGLTATWSATQAGAGKPWTLGLDAQGARLASGYAELDRLLGPQPRLKAQANVGGGQIAVSDASLDGAALHAAAAGVQNADGLKFKLDWTADGPFRAGPVEITGKAKGSGAITGTLGQPRADLLADFDAVDVPRLPLKTVHLVLSFLRGPDGSAGNVVVTASSVFGPATAKSAFRFPGDGVDLTDLAVDAGGLKAAGSIALRGRGASSADLDVALAKGAFLDSGKAGGLLKVTDAAGGAQVRLALTAENAVLPGRAFVIGTGRISAEGPLARLPYAVQASGATHDGKWSLDGRGEVARAGPEWRLGFDGEGRFGRRDLKTTETAVFRFGGPERTARLRLAASDGGTIALDGRMVRDATEVKAQVAKLGLGIVDQDLTGRVDATLNLAGQGGRLAGDLDARLDGVRGRGSDASQGLNGSLKARLVGQDLALDAAVTNSQGLNATANLVLPAESSASPFRVAINRRKPIRGHVFADGEVKPLWDLLVGGERELAGRVRLQGDLGGTLSDIRAVGEASVQNGRFSDGATGLVLRDVELGAVLADNAINISHATGADGRGGTVTGQGRISLLRDGASTFRLDLKGFRLIDNDLATASATGQATIDRNADGKVRLAGALTIDRADVSARTPTPSGVVAMDVVEINRPVDLGGSLPAATNGGGASIALDVSLKAPRRIFLRGKGLDVELSLDAHVGGTTAHPSLSGAARVVRGDYDFAGKRFEFDERGVVYLATSPRDIRLDLTATRDDPSLTAAVRIRGTAAKPEITLTSTPTLPNDEVLSQVLFGRSASQLSPLEAAQLASALSSLAGGGGFDVIGNLKTFAGLDRLSLGGGGQSGVTVSGGKYLTDDVYLELTGGGRDGAAAQVEWRVGRSLSIISKVAGQGDGKLAVRWRKDY